MHILVVGDSNVRYGATALVGELSHTRGHNVTIAAHGGAGVRGLAPAQGIVNPNYWSDRLAGEVADLAVVAIGAADAVGQGTATTPGWYEYATKIAWLHALLPMPTFWSTLAGQIMPPAYADGAFRVNKALVDNEGPYTVLAWQAVANSHPEWMIAGDTHYTPAGHANYATFIANGIGA